MADTESSILDIFFGFFRSSKSNQILAEISKLKVSIDGVDKRFDGMDKRLESIEATQTSLKLWAEKSKPLFVSLGSLLEYGSTVQSRFL